MENRVLKGYRLCMTRQQPGPEQITAQEQKALDDLLPLLGLARDPAIGNDPQVTALEVSIRVIDIIPNGR